MHRHVQEVYFRSDESFEIDTQVEGDTDDEKAKPLVRVMLETGLAEWL